MSVSVDLNNTERVMYQGNNHVKCIYGPNNQLLWSEEEYFTVELLSSGTLGIVLNTSTGTGVTVYYWINKTPNAARDNYDGVIDSSVAASQYVPGLSLGDKVRFYRAETTAWSNQADSDWYNKISGTAEIKISGNIASLIGFSSTLPTFCFRYLFYGGNVVDASELILPWNTLTQGCFIRMFYSSSKLTAPPVLPAQNLAVDCYRLMFRQCTALTTIAPMYCKSNSNANTAFYCMYQLCSGLTSVTVPKLHLSGTGRIWGMFWGCPNLTTAVVDVYPDETLPSNVYQQLFTECTSLSNVTCLATSFASNTFTNWLNNVSASGTFTKAAGVTWPSGVNGIPSGWTVNEI